jgi:hypothetical protein
VLLLLLLLLLLPPNAWHPTRSRRPRSALLIWCVLPNPFNASKSNTRRHEGDQSRGFPQTVNPEQDVLERIRRREMGLSIRPFGAANVMNEIPSELNWKALEGTVAWVDRLGRSLPDTRHSFDCPVSGPKNGNCPDEITRLALGTELRKGAPGLRGEAGRSHSEAGPIPADLSCAVETRCMQAGAGSVHLRHRSEHPALSPHSVPYLTFGGAAVGRKVQMHALSSDMLQGIWSYVRAVARPGGDQLHRSLRAGSSPSLSLHPVIAGLRHLPG